VRRCAVAIPDRELEHSRLSGQFTREGVTVEVQIYRFAGTADAWSLEIVDQEGGSTVWTESFFTDQAAHRAFLHAVEKDGMSQFLEAGETLH
jgi:hypothetical protein